MTDHNDMEDPQHGEILPPMLYEDWFAFRMECIELGQPPIRAIDGAIKVGYELAYQALKPLMQAALPYYEVGVCDTRLGQADAGKLAELARYKEIAEYVK